ncbi:MrcB family domain-containing protein [Bacillus cereus]|uniref:MrcB family domain-containing protein n=1 Tax=Bacillus cereus TaxID=1396 RepID=UPI003D65DD77
MDLAADNKNPKNYMAAYICGKYYAASNIPSDEKLFSDLKELLAVYSQLKSLMMGKGIEEMLGFYLQEEEIEDIQYQSDILVAGPGTTKITKEP